MILALSPYECKLRELCAPGWAEVGARQRRTPPGVPGGVVVGSARLCVCRASLLRDTHRLCLWSLVPCAYFEDDLLAFFKNFVSPHFDSGVVDENVLLLAVDGDETV